jgi:preprotein translocase subunit SecG
MIILLTVFHVIVCVFLILVVLVQQGKGADWAGAFGGGGSQTTFGARSTGSILERATTAAAIMFMITSIALAILISRGGVGNSVIREGAKPPASPTAPATPGQPAQPGQQPPAQGQQPPAPAPQSAPATPATPAPAPAGPTNTK